MVAAAITTVADASNALAYIMHVNPDDG